MIQVCKFDKVKDLQKHVPSLSVDIAKAIDSGGIISTLVPQDFNNMDIEIVQNSTRLREPFDAFEYQVSLQTARQEFSSGTGNNPTPIPPTPPSTPEE